MIYLAVLILIIICLILWRRGKDFSKTFGTVEGFYTLFVPYKPDKLMKYPDFTLYTSKYNFDVLKIGASYNQNDLYAIKFINNLFTEMLTTALISKVKIVGESHDYRLLERMGRGEIKVSVVSEPVMLKIMTDDKAYLNTNPVINVNNSNLQFLSNIGKKYIFIITLVKSGIEKLSDLNGKSIGIGRRKSDTWIVSNDLFNFLGYDVNKVEIDEKLGMLKMYNDGLDAMILCDYYPNKTLVDMSYAESKNRDLQFRIIPINEINTTNFETEYFYFKPSVLDLNKLPRSYLPVTVNNIKYNRYNPDFVTYEFSMMLVCTSDLPPKTAYSIAKSTHENKILMKMIGLNLINMSITFVPISLHRGAVKYYTEHGLITKNKNKNCIFLIGNEECNENALIKHGFV